MAHAAGTNNDRGRSVVRRAGSSRVVSRRGLLLGGLGVLVAGAGGVTAGALRHRPVEHREPPPAELVAALAGEQSLIAGIDATTGGDASVRAALRVIRADHAAHLDALQAAARAYPGASSSVSPSVPPATALTRAALRDAEQAASTRAAAQAATLSGADAALLASIAACEATHAALLG
jgi:hypothetical protein